MNIDNLSESLIRNSKGIWEATKSDTIFYTKNGHELIKDCEEDSFWFRHRLDCISLLIEKFNITSLLDVGGGNGKVSTFLEKKGVTCALLEPGIQAIHNAQSNGFKILINSSLREANFKSNSFAAVGLFDVLEHIEDDDSFIKEIHRILKPEGQLVLTVPSYMFLFSSFDREVGHFRRYTLKNLTRKLTENSFSIDYKTYLFLLLPVPMFISRLFKPSASTITRRKKEHFSNSKFLNKVFRILLSLEKSFLIMKWSIPFGSSCLVIAKKRSV